ncbi:AraC family transcriptional regulator [Roseibacillus ishigakijimensis]|uniref:AraC family transcriptional regulator n=1 Tax=Roseibacillus ishigakijimensis TaxID=454146 RepID=A0A934VGT9_9BACT|nr:AraC family transcriptional regulator [Roseibacillus ishigakijimensis]MBK1833223.1 AraC family transcriptional regulator [Roseibacillus ishigakijimensis]
MRDDRFFQKHEIGNYVAELFDDLPGFVYFIKDRHLRYVAYNRRLCEIFNAEQEDDVLGQTDDPYYPEHLLTFIREDDLRVLETGESVINRVELVPRGTGFVDWATTTKKPLYDQEGAICGIVGVTRPFEQGTATLRKNEELGPALKLLHEGYRDNIGMAELAKATHCSPSTFLRKFKTCFNMTPKEYLRHLRVQEACHLIARSTLTFADISYRCGFADQSHFSREFTRIMKEPPSAYRARYQM